MIPGSYVGGGVNFVAVAESYKVESKLTNPLLVADNFIMAGLFVVLLSIAASKFFAAIIRIHIQSRGITKTSVRCRLVTGGGRRFRSLISPRV